MAARDVATAVGEETRAGARVLSLFANPLNAQILRAHLSGPRRGTKLLEEIAWPAPTTLRASVSVLCDIGALEKRRLAGPRGGIETELTPAGKEVLLVADALEAWLAQAPDGPIAADSETAKGAVKALTGGWSSTMVRALAGEPRTLTELDSLIPDVNYPSLERRLAKMRVTRQIAPAQANGGRGTPYEVTEWLRRSVAPLCAAGRCERRHLADVPPITSVEVEAVFLLALPLVSPPPAASGIAMLAVRTDSREPGADPGRDLAGVTVQVDRGEIVSCLTSISTEPRTWGLGSPEAWLDAVIDGRLERLRFGGAQPQLAAELVSGLHYAFFAESSASASVQAKPAKTSR